MQGLRRIPNALITAAIFLTAAAAQVPAPGINHAGVVEFAVASIRENTSNQGRWGLGFTPDGCSALAVTAKQLIEYAYGVYEDDRFRGLPKWADSEKYNLEAKVDPDQVSTWQGMHRDQRRAVLQALLRDRLHLNLRQTTENRPDYELVIAKGGPKLQKSRSESGASAAREEPLPTVSRSKPGKLVIERMTTAQFADFLSQSRFLSRRVVDLTGLKDKYDITLNWDPEETAAPAGTDSSAPTALTTPASPAIFTALREQLGLQLKPGKDPVSVFIVERIDHPTDN
jgi:uncharacterized protein (TIGR03435 family)